MKEMYRIEAIGLGPSHGTLTIYCAPRAVIRHIEWTISNVFGAPIELKWKPLSIQPTNYWTTFIWRGPSGSAALLASELSGWHYLRFEIHEASSASDQGSMYFFVPELGIYRGATNAHGDLMINEHQVSAIVREHRCESDVITEIERALGRPWDEDLECYRRAIIEGDDSHVVKISV